MNLLERQPRRMLEMRSSRLRRRNKIELTETETNKAIAGIMNYHQDLLALNPLDLANLFDATMNDPAIVKQQSRWQQTRWGRKVSENLIYFNDESSDKNFIYNAFNIAFNAHQVNRKQWRNFSNQPYIVHPLRVALLSIKLAQAMGVAVTPELIAAGLGHDVIEDSVKNESGARMYTRSNVEGEMQARKRRRQSFAADTEALSHHDVHHEDGRTVDEQAYHAKIMDGDEEAIERREIVKAADKIDNLLDPPQIPEEMGSLVYPRTELAARVNKQRWKYIREVEDENGIVNRLLRKGSFLRRAVDRAKSIARQTVSDPRFTLEGLRQQLADTMEVDLLELQASRYQPPENMEITDETNHKLAISRMLSLYPENRLNLI